MRINSKAGTQSAAFDGSDAGEGLAIFLSQTGDAVSRYRVLVKAMIGEGVYQVGTFYTSPPNATFPQGRLTRMVAAALCPGATSWEVEIVCADTNITYETADIVLASSKCYASPVGVCRVAERYNYLSNGGAAPQSVNIRPGQTITSIGMVGLTGGGTAAIDGGDTIVIPAGVGVNLEPKAPIQFASPAIVFTNVDFTIEYLESA